MGERGGSSSSSSTVLWLHVCVLTLVGVSLWCLCFASRIGHACGWMCVFAAVVRVRWIVGSNLGKEAAQALAPSLAMLTQLQSLNLGSECLLQHGGGGQ